MDTRRKALQPRESQHGGLPAAAALPLVLEQVLTKLAARDLKQADSLSLSQLGEMRVVVLAVVALPAPPAASVQPLPAVVEPPATQEPLFLEQFPEAFVKKTLKTLQGLFVLGCAYKGGAGSLGEASKWLQARHCPLPRSKTTLQARLNAASDLFAKILNDDNLALARREDGPGPPRDSKGRPLGCDTREIIDLSDVGWRAWEETVKFLGNHDPAYGHYAYLLTQ